MKTFTNSEGAVIIDNMIVAVNVNKQYLSDIDGQIGDGDHGINMNKGFQMTRAELDKNPGDLTHSAKILSKILMMKIGGSMGPLYGKMFRGFSKELEGLNEISASDFAKALEAMLSSVKAISSAKPGDKTLVDTLQPAVEAFRNAVNRGKDFDTSLDEMKVAAIAGRDSTNDMIAKIGRASRLGERSRGVPDAGATSCYLLLETMADTVKKILK